MQRHFLLTLLCLQSFFVNSQTPVKLQCEYLNNPLGIDASRPRLSWQIQDARPGAFQSGFELVVGTDSVAVSQGKGSEWQIAQSPDQRQLLVYAGKPLQSFTRYYWSVRIQDKDGKTGNWAAVNSFETAMFSISEWKGSWISDGAGISELRAPYFRKEFNVGKKIRRARAYVAVAGLYDLSINGQKADDHFLDPMYTRFDRRLLYVTKDITNLLQQGVNAVGIVLGNGWYNHQSTAVWNFHEAPWRARPAFCMDIRIDFEDGTTEVISSGKDWKTSFGPIVFNSIYTAEHYDARKEIPGWDRPRFVDTAWRNVYYRSAPAPLLVAQATVPVRPTEKLQPISLKKFSDTCYVFDLGKNSSGISQLSVSGKPGTILRLKHAERLDSAGHADQSNIDVHYRPTGDKDPFQTDIFILKGSGVETFKPSFNYKGFQYVEITSNTPVELTRESLSAYFIHSDVPQLGTLSTSNDLINKTWQATNRAYLSNLVGYFTDCPQREKNGWTGDAHIASETGLYNFDGITVYEKWMADHRDEQQPNGVLPSIIPTGGWGYEWGNGPDWTSTIAIIPWNIYLFYGDTTLLSRSYENIRRYVDHINELYPTGLTTWGLGDWIPVSSTTPVELTSTAYYYADVTILASAAKLLGHEADAERYSKLAQHIKNAFNNKYLDRNTGIYGTGVQTAQSVPLQWGLVPDDLKSKVADQLAQRVRKDSIRLDVGLLGTKAILNALSENGYPELAYQLATRDKYPSWGWWIKNGATTLYENWPINSKSDISLNHIMFGEIGAWFFKGLGGIFPVAEQPGFKHFRLEPNIINGLDKFEVSHASPYGLIYSSWIKKGKKTSYRATIPAGTTAALKISVPGTRKILLDGKPVQRTAPGKLETVLNAGEHVIEF